MFRSPVVDGIVILIIALLILGPKRLPGLGKGLGVGMREFKEGITGEDKDENKPEITPATPVPDATGQSRPTQSTGSSTGTAGPEQHS